jgi:hypothetical protein
VLDDPRAFLEVDETTILICIGSDIPVHQIVADIARPAIMIWDEPVDEDPEIPWYGQSYAK